MQSDIDLDMRLRCLTLANTSAQPGDQEGSAEEVVERAQRYYAFVRRSSAEKKRARKR